MPFDMPVEQRAEIGGAAIEAGRGEEMVGLSRAELTLRPVARRSWTLPCISAVFCKVSRFERIELERTIPFDMTTIPFWAAAFSPPLQGSCFVNPNER
jgi:hypothetical protein